jgi:hypothetical protein
MREATGNHAGSGEGSVPCEGEVKGVSMGHLGGVWSEIVQLDVIMLDAGQSIT